MDAELEVTDGNNDDKTSLYSEHEQKSPLNGRLVHLREDRPRMAFSVENLHVESEGATYLAGLS